MAYQLRFESNAFEAGSAIGKLLDKLQGLSRNVQRFAGAKVRADEVNKLTVLRGVCQRSFEGAMDWADQDFDQQMIESKWRWENNNGNQTRRKNGEVVGTPRDIVDTGELLQSKKRNTISQSVTEFIWEDDVAELVHNGGKSKNGNDIPARPWTEPTLEEIDLIVAGLLRKEGR